MSLEEVLKKAVEYIRAGSLKNETDVKEWVILPILRELDWNDPAELASEFSVDGGRVDYALLRSGGTPLVFIEAKGPDLMDTAGEEQVFGYAAHRGVPFLILTNGNLWDFYLSMAEGPPGERRFYRAELKREERIVEYVEFLEAHLQKERVTAGKARQAAEKRHESNQERKKALAAIPSAWQALLEGPDELLRELLAEEVESSCGTKPDPDDVERFLRGLLSEFVPPTPSPVSPSQSLAPSTIVPKRSSQLVGFVLYDKRVEAEDTIQTLTKILNEFIGRDPKFTARLTVAQKKESPIIARNRDEIYISNPSLIERYGPEKLDNGCYMRTSYNTRQARTNIKIACEVAGVKFGSELKLIER